MSDAVKPIPDGYHAVTPYLIIGGAAEAIEFYKKAFGATERMRMPGPGGIIMHAEIEIGGSAIMLADECEMTASIGMKSPKTLGGSPVMIHLYVESCDATVESAVAAGAKLVRPLADQFYGDRSGSVEDPFGFHWGIATHVEDLTPEEIAARAPKA